MKRTRTIILGSLLAAATLTSCDMDKYPYDGIAVDNAIESLDDCQKLRNGLYRDLRILASTTSNFLATEMQADGIIPTNNYGNQWSSQYLWNLEAADESATGMWNNNYVTIAQSNLIIDGINRLQTEGSLADDDLTTARNILGEAYMVRAMCYLDLATKFCNLYDPTTADNEMGVPLVTSYAPSSDNSTFPGRSSLADTYRRITDDLASARQNLNAQNAQASEYLTPDALTALEARTALLMKEYDRAIEAATSLISSNRYPLISNLEEYRHMWQYDEGTELICQLFASEQEPSGAMGAWFLDEITYNITLLPAADMVNLYGEQDIRLNTYFAMSPVVFGDGSAYQMAVIYKYPGNPNLYTGANTYMNKPKLFRMAEMYLVAAEAYCMKGGADNESTAYNTLYALMSARDNTLLPNRVTGNALRQLIRTERLKELCYEGFRWLDLKRYGEGFTRMQSQADELSYNFGLNQTVRADNHQWLWPIPQDEIESNPQISDQQNPQY